MTMKAELDRLLALDYPVELFPDRQGGGFVAANPDLPGCITQAETAAEAIASLDSVRRHWIELRLQQGIPVPEPVTHEFSGRVLLRMPSSLHAELAHLSKRRGVSLNLLMNAALAEYVGYARARAEVAMAVKR
jgi:antitoxin HicB